MVAMIKPMYPLLEYVVQYQYYSEVLCENKSDLELNCKGKCVLAKKLKAYAEDEELPFTPPTVKIEVKDLPITTVDTQNETNTDQIQFTYLPHWVMGKESTTASRLFIPPRA